MLALGDNHGAANSTKPLPRLVITAPLGKNQLKQDNTVALQGVLL